MVYLGIGARHSALFAKIAADLPIWQHFGVVLGVFWGIFCQYG
jgi:hypothetical protein